MHAGAVPPEHVASVRTCADIACPIRWLVLVRLPVFCRADTASALPVAATVTTATA
jgi:hypothetical protein